MWIPGHADSDMVARALSQALSTPYSSYESTGVVIVVVTAGISLLCVSSLLGMLILSMWRNRSSSDHVFVRTHAASYFTCLLLSDIIQAIGSLMSSKWVQSGGVTLNSFCSTQGAIKNAGNLGISLWSLALAVHTFCVLFLRWKPTDRALYITLFGIWFLIGFIVLIGPAAIQKPNKGPYFGIAGYWCWIADPYPTQRIVLEYLWMLGSAGISLILYVLTYLRLRGNIHIQDGKLKFRMVDQKRAWKYQASRDSADVQMTTVAKGMIGFPILFTVTILPIAICRFVAWSGKDVPIEATIFADSVFSLSGVFDMILFMTTRSLLPSRGMLPTCFLPRPKISAEVMEHGVQPYNVQDFASAHGFNEMYQSQAERTMVTLPPRTSASLAHSSSLTIPTRPARPLSLGDASFIISSPEESPSDHINPAHMDTTANQYSHDDDNNNCIDYPELPESSSPGAWDEVDLGRKVSPLRDDFGAAAPERSEANSSNPRYTTFSLSAYTYGDAAGEHAPPPPPPPPLPSSTGVIFNVGRSQWDDDDDEEGEGEGEGGSERRERDSNGSSIFALSTPEVRSPEPVAKRF